MSHFLKSDSVVIDIGGNIGLFSLFSAKTIQKEGKIISFEPFSVNFERFQENIALNSFSTIVLEKQAVGDSVGSIRLYYDFSEGNLGMVSTKKIDNATSEEVPVNTIDNYLKTKPLTKIDFIKIDVEGHELSVLNGMVDTIKQYHPTILLEVLDNDENAMKVLDFMQKMQYQKSYINDDGTLSAIETNSKRKNYIFTYNNELK
ncbi:MAG: FkbM family methyltransferase [Crocinitomicaceae bacterium]|nr:FkbM family methyltransferase [Crocinitomicaceae bacterium]